LLVKHGRLQTVFISILGHGLFFWLLIDIQFDSIKRLHNPTDLPIKAYVYQRAPVVEKIINKPISKADTKSMESSATITADKIEPINVLPKTERMETPPKINKSKQILSSTRDDKSKPSMQVPKSQKPSIDALEQLTRLNKSLDQNIQVEKPATKNRQVKSVFNPSPMLVPKATMPIDEAEQRAQNTTHYGNGIAITKLKNGICLIEEDLSKIGIDGVTARSSFTCGESEFDKSFREHMKNVRNKLKKP